MKESMIFDDETVAALFGHEAAENESIDKLMLYYFKNDIFKRVTAHLPLRILVGHKGIGKSALLSVAREQDKQDGIISIFLKNNDISIANSSQTFNEKINSYKQALTHLIYERVINEYCNQNTDEKNFEWLKIKGFSIIDAIENFVKPLLNNQVPDSKYIKSKFIKNFIENKKEIIVYIDDLDRGWSASKEAISQLSALINALRDLSSENRGLLFKIALRSDVYYLVRTSDESTDKIEGSVIWHTWTNHEILALFAKRIESFYGNSIDDTLLVSESQNALSKRFEKIIDPIFYGKGKWEKIPTYRMLMTLIRRRPRDIIKLCTLAAQEAYRKKSPKIKSEHFSSVFDSYSQSRLQDTINEYSSELSNLKSLLLSMRNSKNDEYISKNLYSTAQINKKVKNIISNTDIRFTNEPCKPSPSDIASFLYKIGFLIARKDTNEKIIRKYFEDQRYITPTMHDAGFNWEVHPAFRWALDAENTKSILDEIDPTDNFEE